MKILGLDLGVGSVGWAVIETDDNFIPLRILGMGSRVINLSSDEKGSFSNGKGESLCSKRTFMRTARKGLDRYQMRRKALLLELEKLDMTDTTGHLLALSPMDTWQLRANAATLGEKLSLKELGRVLLHLNQKRGYRHAKDDEGDASQRDYVTKVNNRYLTLKEAGMTAGQYFASELRKSEQFTSKGGRVYSYRIKERVLPRKAYQEEFDRIMDVQKEFYPDILTDAVIKKLRDIIFYQRPLKSCKRLVSVCEFETRRFLDRNGNEVNVGSKVAPRTSPLAQLTRIHEAVNNIVLVNHANKHRKKIQSPSLFSFEDKLPKDARLLQYKYNLDPEEREKVVEYLMKNEKLSASKLLELLNLKKSDGFRWEGTPKNGLEGNKTYVALKEAVEDFPDADEKLLRFNIELEPGSEVNPETGEIYNRVRMIYKPGSATPVPQYIEEPLYKLWHTVYSSTTLEELTKAMQKVFGITDSLLIERLYKLDFVKPGYANRSAKFMRRILPMLMNGEMYSKACEIVGVNHSGSLTKEENEARKLKDHLSNLHKGDLRQPVVEKILNQMINVVNAVKDRFGELHEIRVELARELKQTKDQRAEATSRLASSERENAKISEILLENGIRTSRRNIQKYKLWYETGHRCIYCNRPIGMPEYFGGEGEIEHIIPRSLLFDDSMSNKVCSCRDCNKDKAQQTAEDFMRAKGELEYRQFEERVNNMLKEKKISKTKRIRLLTPKEEIPADFLERDMRLTQYISRKAMEILKEICHNVHASSGAVTDFMRHQWGYDMILQNLNLDRYAQADFVEEIPVNHGGQTHMELRIKDWSKRLDHRHHSIDALVVALTRQGYVQRLNNLNSERGNILSELAHPSSEYGKKIHLLEQWAKERPHFPVKDVAEAVDRIAVSLKSGKKLTTPGKRFIRRGNERRLVQDGLTVPRGSLHQETVYGKVKVVRPHVPVKNIFENPDAIVNETVRRMVFERLSKFEGDVKSAVKSLKKDPLKLSIGTQDTVLTEADMFEEMFTTRKPVNSLTQPMIEKISDASVKAAVRRRLEECGGNVKKMCDSFSENPLILDNAPGRTVKRVRILSNDSMVCVRKNSMGEGIGFAMPGGNHHVAFYRLDGKTVTTVITFWNAIKRKNMGLPAVVTKPDEVWDQLAEMPDSPDVDEVSRTLPPIGSEFILSFKMGDMFILGLSNDELNDAFRDNDMKTLTAHLYRVQKLAYNDYNFRLHTWTSVDAKKASTDTKMGAYLRVASYKGLEDKNPCPVIVDNLGQIYRRDD